MFLACGPHYEDGVVPSRRHQFLAVVCFLTLLSGCGDKDGEAPDSQHRFTPASITLRERGALKELLDESLIFIDSSGVKWVAPKGTLTDGASVPRLALPLTDDRFGPEFLKAAVVHDAYCQKENETRTPDQYHKKPWKAVHRMFYEAMLAGGTSELKAQTMFVAVWLVGPRWDDPDREVQELSEDTLTRGFTGAKQWIEKNKPTIEEIEADIERREPVLRKLHEFETEILAALQGNNKEKARALLREEETLLTSELGRSPADSMLLNFKGYWHKNRAILFRMSNSGNTANEELSKSERTFKAILETQPEDPSALNGLGSVSILSRDLDRAEIYVKKALAIAPDYQEAKHDLQLIRKLREH